MGSRRVSRRRAPYLEQCGSESATRALITQAGSTSESIKLQKSEEDADRGERFAMQVEDQ